MSDLVVGVRSVFRAIGLIAKDRRVRRLAIAPLIINIVFVLVGLPIAIWLATDLGIEMIPGAEGWPAAIRVLVQVIVVIVVAIVGVIFLLVLARVVAGPLMTRLSEAVEERMLGERFEPRHMTIRDEVVDVGRGIGFALGRLLLFALLYPPILLLGLIPGAGPFLAPIFTFLYGAFVLSLDFSEPAFERHLPGFRRRIGYVLGRPMLYLGFGGVAVAMALVPFANLAVLPVCVAGATIAYLESSGALAEPV
jgi:CysZ protein